MRRPAWAADAELLRRATETGDYLRRAPARVGGPPGHKEWLHFCAFGPDVDVLLNFSSVDDVHHAGHLEHHRVTALVRTDHWRGDVKQAEGPVRVRRGQVGARFGSDVAAWDGEAYHLHATIPKCDLVVDLRLVPMTLPSIVHNVSVGDGPPIHWLVMPRLLATGTVVVDGRRHVLHDVPAYHDHNWGNFRWGRNFAWEWGYILPDDAEVPWSLVFVRLSDRAHARTRMQGLFAWHGSREDRVFRGRQLDIRGEGVFRTDHLTKVPAVMGLLSPGTDTGVPGRMRLLARDGEDHVDVAFQPEEAAQVIIPNDDDDGVTIIHEVAGEVTVEGRIRGRSMSWRSRSIFEFLGD